MTTVDPVEWYADVPRRVWGHAVLGFALMVLAFGGFGIWAFRAPLAAAVMAQGSFVATGQNKVMQHLEGGIIAEILVREGETVSAGQPIVRLDGTLASATKRELDVRRARLEATEARLLAEHRGADRLLFPASLTDKAADLEIASIMEGQRKGFEVARSALANDLALIGRNIEALEARRQGYALQRQSLAAQAAILSEELGNKQGLLDKGIVSRDTISALRRALLDAQGQGARLEAEVQEIDSMRARYQTQIERTLDEHRQAALSELQGIQAELESVREQLNKAENVLSRTELLAPVAGTVVRLYYHTAGGVIEPGRAVAEILPADAPLIVETLISRSDIDSVQVGQEATIKLNGLNQRTTPVLSGRVDYVSADAVATGEPASGREAYVVRASLTRDELRRVRHFTPKPGMPVEIMIRTETRSFAQYIAKPVIDSMSRAFREQ
ncbi:HlyD family type I secretion periplasmic adaptor subunit [Paenirhodobacter sp. CAU 1674]|jgi:HlyD family secretion protein|uniref:HlyD family type I secretion periplasmic adaptor subunit n=1 Tax=Paenirhodobacter sp. CAU 1674 TaxID=3032596 RepID=UPI0023DA4354|nr:HlyD family type I secretion periplasmic adaptor subunit [Paenirhodobacter sp. CAU 1674]MDF2140288.1 HlyD family type I secretion periplasmic adaptor subunit [Paenirhodobacter sp. CAU 1674]